jgi:hypothetical protein
MNFQVKVLQNKLGQWAVWWGVVEVNKLAYRRFFKEKTTAEIWAKKFSRKMLRN